MNRRSASDPLHPSAWNRGDPRTRNFLQDRLKASPRGEESRLSAAVSSAISTLGREKSPALVRIRCRDNAGEISGTGFLIDPAGTVCTLAEFVRDRSGIEVEIGGKAFPAAMIFADERTGIAFLRSSVAASCFIPPSPLQTSPSIRRLRHSPPPPTTASHPRRCSASRASGSTTTGRDSFPFPSSRPNSLRRRVSREHRSSICREIRRHRRPTRSPRRSVRDPSGIRRGETARRSPSLRKIQSRMDRRRGRGSRGARGDFPDPDRRRRTGQPRREGGDPSRRCTSCHRQPPDRDAAGGS